jgi:antitoxin component of RelBE/YafQ-DinJ toxin-antitoxin module
MNNFLRSKYIQFRASNPEVLTLNQLSYRMGLSVSETMRTLIREAAASRNLPEPGAMVDIHQKIQAKAKHDEQPR